MLTYMQRYLHGEHEQVWSELRALGDAVRDEPLLGDARAVARETMRRAHHNIEVLIPRLQSLGYTFGYAWLAERTHERFTPEGIAELERDEPVYRPPLPDAVERIAELEALAGALPITLRAWYEVVGSVNFIGTAPPQWRDLGYQGYQGEAYKQFEQAHPRPTREEWRQFEREHPEFRKALAAEGIYLDPLTVVPIEITILMSDFGDPDNDRAEPAQARVGIAPDWYHKYFISGGGPYFVTTPCLAADAPLEGMWFEATFVEYLRACFRWAGFPGLAHAPKPPLDDIATLTRDLLLL